METKMSLYYKSEKFLPEIFPEYMVRTVLGDGRSKQWSTHLRKSLNNMRVRNFHGEEAFDMRRISTKDSEERKIILGINNCSAI